MKKITIAFLAGCFALVAGCWLPGVRGNGHIKIDERQIGDFTSIDASGAFVINWQNGAPALRIKTDENLFPYIESEISGNTLRLHTREQIRPTHGGKNHGSSKAYRKPAYGPPIRFGRHRRIAYLARWQYRSIPCRYDRRK